MKSYFLLVNPGGYDSIELCFFGWSCNRRGRHGLLLTKYKRSGRWIGWMTISKIEEYRGKSMRIEGSKSKKDRSSTERPPHDPW